MTFKDCSYKIKDDIIECRNIVRIAIECGQITIGCRELIDGGRGGIIEKEYTVPLGACLIIPAQNGL